MIVTLPPERIPLALNRSVVEIATDCWAAFPACADPFDGGRSGGAGGGASF